MTEKAPAFGVLVGEGRVDGRAVMDRVRSERDRFVGFVVEAVEDWPAEQRVMGQARFAGDHLLVIERDGLVVERVEAGRIVIATGSTIFWPDHFNAAGDRLVTSDDVFYWDDLPASVAVFGGGVVGLELGQALSRLGVRVRLFGKGGRIGIISDPEVRAAAITALGDELAMDLDADVQKVERSGDQVSITFKGEDGETVTESFDYLLAATGRRPAVAGLGLETTSLELDAKGIPTFDPFTMQCGQSHVFIAGDVDGDKPILHEAADEGRIAGDNAGRFPDIRAGLRRTPMGVVFTDPNIATAGESYGALQASGCAFATGEVDFGGQGRSRVMLQNKGLLRVYGAHGSGKFLGAEMVGPRTEHIAHLLAWSAQQGLTVAQMLDMPYYHPVIEEGLRTALRDLNRQLKLGPEMVKNCMDCGPGA
jgi:dihydrolipoamide dehydrogenase